MYSLTDAITSLRTHFGFDNFREGQRDVIEAVLAGRDVVVVMPTGSGKSLCYQLPAMILDGATVPYERSGRRTARTRPARHVR
jgi:ATP-dependent DNA helicase RecQ